MRKTLNEIQTLRKIQFAQEQKKAKERFEKEKRDIVDANSKLLDILKEKLMQNPEAGFGKCIIDLFEGMLLEDIISETSQETLHRIEQK